jgi:cysteine-rich repeat protein
MNRGGESGAPITNLRGWTIAATLVCLVSTGCKHDIHDIQPGWGRPDGDAGSGCGNGEIDEGEQCDGEDLAGQDCASVGFFGGTLRCDAYTCRFDTSMCDSCGDGNVDRNRGEQCDGDNLGGEDCRSIGYSGGILDCDSKCRFDESGCAGSGPDGGVDGGRDAGEDGGTGGNRCGNNEVETYRDRTGKKIEEVCDDGNQVDGDGCSANCLSDETCGNGYRDEYSDSRFTYREACDDGNTEDGDGCSRDCFSDETCGNGVRDHDEKCDDGNTDDGDDCSGNCRVNNRCSNGLYDGSFTIHRLSDAARLGGCNTVQYDLTINPSEFMNLHALRDLTTVRGNLTIEVSQYSGTDGRLLTTLEGLESLSHVGGDLGLGVYGRGGTSLANVDALENLTSVDGSVWIYMNYDLENLKGLGNLGIIGQDLYIKNNPSLKTLNGFNTLQTINGAFEVLSNEKLANLNGLANVTVINGSVNIGDNQALKKLSALAGLTTVGAAGGGADLKIESNPQLAEIGFDSLTTIAGKLSVSANGALTSLAGLNSLNDVGGELTIDDNDDLEQVDDLGNLNQVGGALVVQNNAGLQSLSLETLGSVGSTVYIENNDVLSEIDTPLLSYASGTWGGTLTVRINPSLPRCEATELRTDLGTDKTHVNWTICENLGDFCSTECDAASDGEFITCPGCTIAR